MKITEKYENYKYESKKFPQSDALKLNKFVFSNIVQEGQDPSETP